MKVIVTGVAGFIGMNVCARLLEAGHDVIGLDNLSSYYDVQLKEERLQELKRSNHEDRFSFRKLDVADRDSLFQVFDDERPKRVVHLAAQAGVRYSLEAPSTYIDSNLVGFGNILEAGRNFEVEHLLYASSSSVYGKNRSQPFSEEHVASHPVSLYAATKRANEVMAHSYSHLFGLPTTGLRFFTVYGPWGRPDMALFKFTDAIQNDRPIDVYNHGNMRRDFTYVDDVTDGVIGLLDHIPHADPSFSASNPTPATSDVPYRIYNIGSHRPTSVMDFIASVERALGKKAEMNMLPMQPGDVEETYADVSALEKAIGFSAKVSLDTGVQNFVDWYLAWSAKRTEASARV